MITGGGSGMGRASALRFLDEGARVVIGDLNEGTAKDTLSLADEAGHEGRIAFERVDVASEPDVEALIARAAAEFGRIDVLFNNAGVGGALGPLTETRVEDWDYTFSVLVRSVFLGIKHGARAMQEQGEGGVILNTAAVAALSGGAGPPAYSACKAAVVNLTRSAAVQLAEHRIRVNAICPGGIVTPLLHRGNEETARERLKDLQPWSQPGESEDVAAAALFLASDEARFVTGEAMVVDGGLSAAGPSLPRRFRKKQKDVASQFEFVGVDRGTTGEPPVVRRLAPRKED